MQKNLNENKNVNLKTNTNLINSSLLCQVLDVRHLTPSVCEISFDIHSPFNFQAGQYLNVLIPGVRFDRENVYRAYSFSLPPEKRPYEFCFEKFGPSTEYLQSLQRGDTFRAFGPYGSFQYEPRVNRHFCFVATGVGIGVFRSIYFSEKFQNSFPLTTTCIFETENQEELIYQRDFVGLRALHFIPILTQPKPNNWWGHTGSATQYLKRFGEKLSRKKNKPHPWKETDFFLCGKEDRILEAEGILLKNGVPKEAIQKEAYFFIEQTRPYKFAS